jgi:hypothetical protein
VTARTGVPTNRSSFVGWPSAAGPAGRPSSPPQKTGIRNKAQEYICPLLASNSGRPRAVTHPKARGLYLRPWPRLRIHGRRAANERGLTY